VEEEVTLGDVYLRVLRFSPVSIILPLLHTHSIILILLLSEGQAGEAYTFKKSDYFSDIGVDENSDLLGYYTV
jgi:hypothetical protein